VIISSSGDLDSHSAPYFCCNNESRQFDSSACGFRTSCPDRSFSVILSQDRSRANAISIRGKDRTRLATQAERDDNRTIARSEKTQSSKARRSASETGRKSGERTRSWEELGQRFERIVRTSSYAIYRTSIHGVSVVYSYSYLSILLFTQTHLVATPSMSCRRLVFSVEGSAANGI
jgi:hypothetical protein